MSIDWDRWRLNYKAMTYEDMVEFYDAVWTHHPDQHHFTREALIHFFAESRFDYPNVIEVGGWTGEAAQAVMTDFHINSWLNLEICRGAAENPVCDDERYSAFVPLRWVWDLDYEQDLDGKWRNIAVLSHVIEHLSADDLERLIAWLLPLGVAEIYVESPLSQVGQDWKGYIGSHVLPLGWVEVIDLFQAYGYEPTESVGQAVFFRKRHA